MKILGIFLFLILINLSWISAICEGGQIDINSASAGELEKLDGVGEKIAQYIIDERPFGSIDELINVYRIGEVTLEKIKKQGLACVEKSEDSEEEEIPKTKAIPNVTDEKETPSKESTKIQTIALTTQTIKSEDNKKDKGDYATYGFFVFSILISTLFILKKRKYKNEFR